MTKPFVLVCDGMDASIFKSLQDNSNLEVHPNKKCTQEEIMQVLPKADAIIIRSSTNPDKAFLDAATNLKYIIRAGEGTDNIDKAYCKEKGIKVSNTPGANNNSAAEHALALMLTVLRHTANANASMKTGEWNKAAFTGNELWKKKIGIVGFGRIGQLLCKRLQGFEPEVMFFDPGVTNTEFDYATKVDSVAEIFKTCDVISIHTPLIDATRNMVNTDMLNHMKPNAILINAARGNIVVEDDLYNHLKEGKIKGAGFDVFSKEPLSGSNLTELNNIVLTPHLGGSTEEAQFRVGEMAGHQVCEFLLNNNLLNEVKA